MVMNAFNETKLFLGAAALSVLSSVAAAEVVFEESFDGMSDWTSTMHTTSQTQKVSEGAILPGTWDAIYQGTMWSPETGFPDNHASLEILAANSEKARGEIGKSAVFWRESYDRGWNNWASDAQLIKYLDREYEQLYVEFWVRFSNSWYGRKDGEAGSWTSKIFRIGSYDGEGNPFNGAAGSIGPLFLWDWKRDNYGVRNILAFYGGPHGENYKFNNEYKFGGSLNFSSMTLGMGAEGTDPLLLDRVNGGYLKDYPGIVDHDQVFGPGDSWTKVAFFIKMNSKPDATDGVLTQWINGTQIHHRDDIPWIMSNSENKMVGWNYFAIGGNDYFQAYPNEQRYEDWFSIDDLKIMTSVPDDLAVDVGSPPKAPGAIKVE